MRTTFVARLSTALVGLSLGATSALAHHGWAGQGTEAFELKGTVSTPVSLAGPHATMQIKDASGQLWDLTLAPGARTERAGLTADAIPVGAEVSIVGKRNLDPKRFEVKTERVTYDGRNFDVYPDRL